MIILIILAIIGLLTIIFGAWITLMEARPFNRGKYGKGKYK